MRSELSKKNKYYLPRERYLELTHFCRQYTGWLEKRALLLGPYTARANETGVHNGSHEYDKVIFEYMSLSDRISTIEKAALDADKVIGHYIIEAVSTGKSYDAIKAQHHIPCCRNTFYVLRRRFFWLLDRKLRHDEIGKL